MIDPSMAQGFIPPTPGFIPPIPAPEPAEPTLVREKEEVVSNDPLQVLTDELINRGRKPTLGEKFIPRAEAMKLAGGSTAIRRAAIIRVQGMGYPWEMVEYNTKDLKYGDLVIRAPKQILKADEKALPKAANALLRIAGRMKAIHKDADIESRPRIEAIGELAKTAAGLIDAEVVKQAAHVIDHPSQGSFETFVEQTVTRAVMGRKSWR